MESTIRTTERTSKADRNLQYSAVIVVCTAIPKVDVSKDHRENNKINHEKDRSTVTCGITKIYLTDK